MACATIKVGFFADRQLKNFLRLLRAMQYCGDIGHSTSFNVGVDGDGAFKMDVEVLKGNDEKINLRDCVPLDDKIYWEAVKEFHKWCPESKNELAFGFE